MKLENPENKKINVLYFNNNFSVGGTAIVSRNLIEQIKHQGVNPVIICPGKDLVLTEEFRKCSNKVETVNSVRLTRTLNPIKWLLYVISFVQVNLKLLKIIRKYKIDILHANSLGSFMYSFLVGKIMHILVIWHMHDILKERLSNRILCKILGLFATNIIAVSNAVRNSLLGFGIKENKIKVIYNGLNLEKWNPTKYNPMSLRNELKIDKDSFIFAIIAQITECKGQHIFIESAANILRKHREDVLFLIIGESSSDDAEYKKKLMERVKELNVEEKIVFTGRRNDIPNVFASINVSIVCSIWPDSFPTVILEALAMAKPVIATNIGGISEEVVNNETGILVPPGNTKELVKAMTELLNNPKRGEEMGIKGRERMEKMFTIKKNVSTVKSLYYELLQN